MSTETSRDATRPARGAPSPRLFTAAGLALGVPLAVTVFMMLTETTAPGTVAGTYAFIAVEHLVALVGAVVLVAVGRHAGRSVRGLGVAAVVLALVLIATQLWVMDSDPNIGGGFLWLVTATLLAVLGGVATAASRRA